MPRLAGAQRLETARDLLVVDGVGRTFAGATPVNALKYASFRVPEGELVGIVGRSGSGKSTLLNVLGLLDVFTRGEYSVGETSIAELSERERTNLRATFFGFVFQQAFLLGACTAQENVELSLRPRSMPKADRQRMALEALVDVGLHHRRGFLARTLSGGECQRVAIARAIAQGPRVLLCDEPTGNLDERTTDEILGLLANANESGTTVILVTHDLRIARELPRVLTVRDGIVSEGLHEESMVGPAPGDNRVANTRRTT